MSVKFDISELVAYRDKLVNAKSELDPIVVRVLNGIAATVMQLAKDDTPVGVYDKPVRFTTKDGVEVSFTPKTGKQGGTLKRGWKVESYTNTGGVYQIKVVNNTNYASWVEDGHRIVRNGATIGAVPGLFMLKIAEDKVRAEVDNIVELELKKVFERL